MSWEHAIAPVAGVFTWSLAEYLIHRFVGHDAKSQTAFAREHRAHHADGNYFAPTIKKVQAAAVAGGALLLIAAASAGWVSGALYVLGFLAFYAVYEVLHRRIHTHAPIGFYGRWARRHHLYHHFQSPRLNHGVTSPLWDIVFRTLARTDVVRIPARQAVVWMHDPETREVLEPFRADFEVVGQPSSSS